MTQLCGLYCVKETTAKLVYCDNFLSVTAVTMQFLLPTWEKELRRNYETLMTAKHIKTSRKSTVFAFMSYLVNGPEWVNTNTQVTWHVLIDYKSSDRVSDGNRLRLFCRNFNKNSVAFSNWCSTLSCVCFWLFNVVGWLLNVPATCECISGTDLLRQFYVLDFSMRQTNQYC